jgi:MOSC domain-containing protein YiiM
VQGRIAQLHRKPREGRARGIPKRVAPELTITPLGVEGDFNRWRTEEANGDPDQAVLLLSEEILTQLRAEGWPVQPGELGENLTVADLPPDALRPGARVHVGEVVLEVSKPCVIRARFSMRFLMWASTGARRSFGRLKAGGDGSPESSAGEPYVQRCRSR